MFFQRHINTQSNLSIMEIKDIREFVLGSPSKEWYEKVEYTFPFRCSLESIKKTGFVSIFELVDKQIKGFNSIGNDLPSVLHWSKGYFSGLKSELLDFVRNNHPSQNQLTNSWASVGTRYQREIGNLLNFDSPETKFLIELNKTYPSMVQGSYCYFTSQDIPKDKFGFAGALKAYEFSMDGGSKISRPSAEKGTLTKLSQQIEASLDQSEKVLLDHLTQSNTKANEFSTQIDELKKQKEDLFKEWFDKSMKEFEDLSEKIDSRRQELEKTYNEIFFLKEPAKYWKDRADELGVEGKSYLKLLYILIGIGASSLFILLWQIPDGMLLNIFKGEASAIKWTIVYVTFISFLAFGIKTLSKLAYSTYHLKRDAEERHQLTYVYLSLVNDKKMDEKDRQLVLQSLFSRADTGLLKDDSSPTMPGLIGSVFNRPS